MPAQRKKNNFLEEKHQRDLNFAQTLIDLCNPIGSSPFSL
jgi:hypothetical protein